MPNTYGRQVVIVLTNKSGGSVAAGDVVVIDTTTDDSFTTTTTGRAELSVGVAQETIASNAVGRVLVSGYAALINVPASVTRGHYIETHTVVKQATGNSARRSGSLGQFGKTSATPSGWIWGATDQTAAGGGSVTAATAQLGADVTIAVANTYYDGPSLVLAAGTYIILSTVTLDGQSVSTFFDVKLWDGTTVGSSAESLAYGGNANRQTISVALHCYVVLGAGATWKVSVAGNATGYIRAAMPNNGAGNNASTITALKIA